MADWTLTRFLDELDSRHVAYTLARVRPSIMVRVVTPGIRWEVEFMDDGSVEVERFTSDGTIRGESWIDDLLAGAD